ncbi:MAG TPA: hypothetical protein VF618_05385 [Thermoanaerobaculia bacterium]
MSALAALLPIVVVTLLVRRFVHDGDTRRAAVIFAILVAVWLAPAWATNRSIASFDFLSNEAPWRELRGPDELIRNPLLNDVVLQFLPWREAARRAIVSGEPPFLDRSASGGAPLWANYQLAILYPVTIAGMLFPTFVWPLFAAASKLLIALYGTYFFLRRTLGHRAALFGAIAYAFGSFTIAFLLYPITNVTVLLPWVLWAIDRGRIGAAVLIATVTITAGHPESALHALLVALPYALWRTPRSLPKLLGVAVLAVLLAAPAWLPFAMLLPESQRLQDIADQPHMLSAAPFGLDTLVPFVVPNYFGNPRVHNYRHAINFNELCTVYAGLVTLALACAAFFAPTTRTRFWALIVVGASALAFAPQHLFAKIPLLGISANGRLRFVITFALIVLAAEALDAWSDERVRRAARVAAVALGVLVVAIALVSYPVFAQVGIRRLIFFTELAALASVALLAVGRINLLPYVLFVDLATVMMLFNPATPREWYYPAIPPLQQTTPARVAGVGLALQPNAATFYGLEDIRPHDPLAWYPYVQFLETHGWNRREYFGRFASMPPQDALRFLGVTHVFTDEGVVPVTGAQPRFRTRDGDVALAHYGARSSVVTVDAPRETFVASSEVALPGWRLTRNGEPWPFVRLQGAFLGWRAPAGRSTFALRYTPPGLMAGWGLAALGAVLLMIVRRRWDG